MRAFSRHWCLFFSVAHQLLPRCRVSPSPDPGTLHLPGSRKKLAYVPRLVAVERQPDAQLGTNTCTVLLATSRPEAVKARYLPACQVQLWVRRLDRLPARISYSNDRGVRVT